MTQLECSDLIPAPVEISRAVDALRSLAQRTRRKQVRIVVLDSWACDSADRASLQREENAVHLIARITYDAWINVVDITIAPWKCIHMVLQLYPSEQDRPLHMLSRSDRTLELRSRSPYNLTES